MSKKATIPLAPFFKADTIEAGCDEAGRGCYAGPVVAAAVILPPNFEHPYLKDSKQLSVKKREEMAKIIRQEARAYAISVKEVKLIDKINILQASVKGMNDAVAALKIKPELLLIDGPYFRNDVGIPHECIVKGDAKFTSIAAASILAKTHRDQIMRDLSEKYPAYDWANNKGYGAKKHLAALRTHGPTPQHRQKWMEKFFDAQASFGFMEEIQRKTI